MYGFSSLSSCSCSLYSFIQQSVFPYSVSNIVPVPEHINQSTLAAFTSRLHHPDSFKASSKAGFAHLTIHSYFSTSSMVNLSSGRNLIIPRIRSRKARDSSLPKIPAVASRFLRDFCTNSSKASSSGGHTSRLPSGRRGSGETPCSLNEICLSNAVRQDGGKVSAPKTSICSAMTSSSGSDSLKMNFIPTVSQMAVARLQTSDG